MSEFVESTETLPESDPRDVAIKELSALCREVIEFCHRLHGEKNERMIGRLEERVFTLTDEIHSKQRDLYLNHDLNVVIAHTREGLPIRVDKVSRKLLWDT